MSSKNADKKLLRKQKRCQQIISADTQIKCGDQPTEYLVICNAGLSTGLQMDQLLEEINRVGSSVAEVIMVPGKSYCFARCSSSDQARQVYDGLHGQSKLGQHDGVLYLSYCDDVPKVDNSLNQPFPPGLLLLEEFVTEAEEQELFNCASDSADNSAECTANTLKHRIVKHFGFEFLYGTNNVDASKPLSLKIPAQCSILWPRLIAQVPQLQSSSASPDQLTVNIYQPGQGIPPHVDTHSAFLDPICSLSLNSDVIMEFRQPSTGAHVSVRLPRRSMLVISGESRYGWTHGITPRKFDIVNTPDGLSLAKRDVRMSFTFRWLQTTPCHCSFVALCDTAKQAAATRTSMLVENPARLERENVHRVYDEIATHFSETRHSPWPQVEEFVGALGAAAVLADIGCGNGKYLRVDDALCKLGGDRSAALLNVCRDRGLNVFQCDCLYVPLRDACMDGCISIAVIHHLASEDRRLQAVREMARILRVGGRALIYVWAKNQAKDSCQSSYLRQNKRNFASKQTDAVVVQHEVSPKYVDGLPVHTNRTQFAHQDMLVPWKLKSSHGETEGATANTAGVPSTATTAVEFLRFYHVFEEHELEALVAQVRGVQVERSFYDQGNWCVVFRKVEDLQFV